MARGTQHVTRTNALLRKEGWHCGQVERRIPGRPGQPFGKTIDLFGFADVLAFKGDVVKLVQVCGSDFSGHVKKMLGLDGDKDAERRIMYASEWLASPYRTLELWGWRKLVKRNQDGSKAKVKRWEPRIKVFTLEDYSG
ncbi:MAG: hypothetical protein ACYTEQ_28860 [Planctomycetota bacterium]|jgi:hypothetical protein